MNWQPPDEIHLRRRIPAGAIFLALVAAMLVGFGSVERDCYFFAVPLFLFAILAWTMAPRGLTMRFLDDCMEDRKTGTRVPYEDITFLRLTGRVIFDDKAIAWASEMQIGFRGGCWRLPKSARVPRASLYDFLLGRSRLLDLPARFPGRLQEMYEKEVTDFGAGQVLATDGREPSPGDFPSVRDWFFALLIIIVSVVVAAAADADDGVIATLGVFTGFLLFILLIAKLSLHSQRKALRKLRAACGLVLSPRGLTLETPALKGALSWAEVRKIAVLNHFNAQVRGVWLKIDGGQIIVGDHFRCPLTEIHRRIEAYVAFERH